MPIVRLRIEDTALLVVDVQEKLRPTIHDVDRLIRNCDILVRMADALELPVIVTEQNPQGLGRTVEPLRQTLGSRAPIEKTKFSACEDEVVRELDVKGRSTVLICGIEAHVCVLQATLDLHERGMQAFLVSDAVSAGQPDQILWAFDRMQRAGAVVTGVVSAMYELMKGSTHPAFRTCLGLAKEATSSA